MFKVARPTWVKVSYLDLDGNENEIEAEDFLARCFMHELDHLAGRLIN
jgi:peptide deformylase